MTEDERETIVAECKELITTIRLQNIIIERYIEVGHDEMYPLIIDGQEDRVKNHEQYSTARLASTLTTLRLYKKAADQRIGYLLNKYG